MSPIIGSSNLFLRTLRELHHQHHHCKTIRTLTGHEVATALRPVYFIVHPDKFGQFPREKDINENSLKQMNSHLDGLMANKQTKAASIVFYMRDNYEKTNMKLKQIKIELSDRDNLNLTVHRILSQFKLPTDYLERIGKQPRYVSSSKVTRGANGPESVQDNKSSFTAYKGDLNVFWMNRDGNKEIKFDQRQGQRIDLRDMEDMIRYRKDPHLIIWLKENSVNAMEKWNASKPIREDISKLCDELKRELHLKDILWSCGWGVNHFRGCLLSLQTIYKQHAVEMQNLKGKTVVFGRQTGVNFDGHIILSIEDVRHNWLNLIRVLNTYENSLKQLPFTESVLSGMLRGIEIDHRKFKPAVMIEKYIRQLEKLARTLNEYFESHDYPASWPTDMTKYQLVVESESGPLMLFPTGQFIIPASCPAFLMVNFITENLDSASHLLLKYMDDKHKEISLTNQCMTNLGLDAIEKDDNVTPDIMIKCCQNLLTSQLVLSRFLRGNRLRVSHYYSVLQDGEICIPWNFKV